MKETIKSVEDFHHRYFPITEQAEKAIHLDKQNFWKFLLDFPQADQELIKDEMLRIAEAHRGKQRHILELLGY